MKIEKFLPVLKKILFIVPIIILVVLSGMVAFCYFYESKINDYVKSTINQKINGQVDYKSAKLTFFSEFPTLTASLSEITVWGSSPFQTDTLLSAKKVNLGIDLLSLFDSKIIINRFTIDEGNLNIQVDSLGTANYNIYTASANSGQQSDQNTSTVAIETIKLKKNKYPLFRPIHSDLVICKGC